MSLMFYYIFILVFTCPEDAYAYIDLGSGSYIIQAIIAMALGLIFMLKQYFRRLIDFFRKSKK